MFDLCGNQVRTRFRTPLPTGSFHKLILMLQRPMRILLPQSYTGNLGITVLVESDTSHVLCVLWGNKDGQVWFCFLETTEELEKG